MTDAMPSNAGDRYHFVYVARRMLDMLPPDSNLSLIQMENLSPADQRLANHPDELLGADLTEYFGGDSFSTASFVEMTQVKYSATHPNETWTLNRLSRNKQSSKGAQLPGTSVLRKLANLFEIAYGVLEESSREKVRVKLITNQTLHATLAYELESIKHQLVQNATLNDLKSGELLKELADNGRATLVALQSVTNLSWKRLSAFLRCWDLSAFNQSMAMTQETDFAQLLDQYVDMGIYFGNLINFVQEHAVPHRKTDIRKSQVYGLLRINETSFFPAPAQLDDPEKLLTTKAVHDVMATLTNTPHQVVLVHGLSGTGKSSTLRLIQQQKETAVVIYDCFGGGQGVGLDTGRFPFKTFFVQLINELARRFHTNLYTTTKIDEDEIAQRFNTVIARVAESTKQAGQRLVIAVDAIDDAVEAAREQPNRQDKSFVPALWKIRWPENCTLVITSRTENKMFLDIKCDYEEVELSGFSQKESLTFLKRGWQDVDLDLLRYAHERTNGNPRVLAKLTELVERESPNDLRHFIDQHAEHTAFEYYHNQVPAVLGNNQLDWLLLATLREASQFITITDLSVITGRSPQDVRTVIERLYFGLRIVDNGEIHWPDKDFVSYVRQFSGNQTSKAQSLLANYCLNNSSNSEYAKRHLSRHLFRAGQYSELITWWMTDDQLARKIATTEPHMEDTAEDIQYTLLAAIELKDFKTALQTLVLAAEIAQGLDVFSTVIGGYPRIVTEQAYLGRLLGYIRRHDDENELLTTLFTLARTLVEYDNQPDLAKQLFDEGYDAAERIKRKYDRDVIELQQDIVIDIAIYHAHAHSLETGLEKLSQWKPKDQVAPGYTDLTYAWCQQHDSQTAVEIIHQHSLNEKQTIYAMLGVLAAGSITENTAHLLVSKVLESIRKGTIENLGQPGGYSHHTPTHLSKVLDTLIKHNLNQAAAELISYWSVRPPNSHHSVDADFAQKAAYQHFLGITTINPETFELEQDSDEKKPLSEHKQKERNEENSKARAKLQLLFPPRLLRLKALAKIPAEEILESVDEFLTIWQNKTKPYWYNFFKNDLQGTFSQLLEAVVTLPGFHLDVIHRIFEVTAHLVGSKDYYGMTDFADILSQYEVYHGEAEKLIYQRLEAICVPDYSASEAVEALLNLYLVASRIDSSLALQIFIRARIEAGSWDSRIDGSAHALIATLQHAQPDAVLSVDQINELVAIFQVIKKVTEGFDVSLHLDWFVEVLTKIHPEYTLAALHEFDKSDFIDLQDSIEGLALALLDLKLPAHTVYPLTHIVNTASQGVRIFEQAIPRLDSSAKDTALEKYADYIKKETARDSREYYAQQMTVWAEQNSLSLHPSVIEIAELAKQLSQFKAENETRREDLSDYYKSGKDLLIQFEKAFTISPQKALDTLLQADINDLVKIRFEELCTIIGKLTTSLPSRKARDILNLIERLNERAYDPMAFSLLTIVAKHAPPSRTAHTEYIESLRQMLTPANLDNLSRYHYRDHLNKLLDCSVLNSEDVFNVFLRTISNFLPRLYANELYRLVGALSRLLSSEESFTVYSTLQTRAAAKLPSSYTFSVGPYATKNDLYSAYIQFLADCLGHPDQTKCWLVLFSLVDVCINYPIETIPLLINELDDKLHPRWMTKRVWLLILLHHLSLRIPLQLVPYIETFISITLDTNFPHAKMRYHAQQTALQIEEAHSGTIDKHTLAHIRAINQPISFMEKSSSVETKRDDTTEVKEWSFGWDTERYWFRKLEDAFDGNRQSVASMTHNWIVEKLAFSAKDLTRESDWVYSKYDYDATNNRQGSLPRVETLKTYAELHAWYLVAGELVDTQPAYTNSWSDQSEWEHDLRYFVRGLDPLLPIRHARPLPTTPANYGLFKVPFNEWVKKSDKEEFECELWADKQNKWIVVSGSFSSDASDRDSSVIIDSYLTRSETGSALARLLNSQDDFVALPYTHSPYDAILSDVINDLAAWNEDSPFSNEIVEDPFLLQGWVVDWHQELPMQCLNPKQEGYGLYLEIFSPLFSTNQRINLNPETLEWYHEDQGAIGYSEFWSNREGRGKHENFISGRRLIVDIEFLLDYLKNSGLELLITVKLRRSRPYNSGYKDGETYDHGTVRAFILSADGQIKLDMDQTLIEKGQSLIAEFSEDNPTTLQKWMAYHLAELMGMADSAGSDEITQAASERCANLIMKLWQIETDKKATELQQRLWNVRRLPSDNFDYELLKNALNELPEAEDLTPEDWSKIYTYVESAESWLIHLLTIANGAAKDVEDSAVEKYLERENSHELIAKLVQIFPHLESADLKDKTDIYDKVVEAMRHLYQLRSRLLWKSTTDEEE